MGKMLVSQQVEIFAQAPLEQVNHRPNLPCTALPFPGGTLMLSDALSPPLCDPLKVLQERWRMLLPQNSRSAPEVSALQSPLYIQSPPREHRSLWTSNSWLITGLRSHIIPELSSCLLSPCLTAISSTAMYPPQYMGNVI